MKRIFDIVFALVGLVVLSPFLIIVAAAIRIESAGSPLFRQVRVGRGGKPFKILKFRTMRTDVDPYGSSPRGRDDPRLTRVGRLLRERSIDELPQLLNVLLGQMSIVGPRPLYERQAAQWNEDQRRRLEVRPGITGYAQVHGRASATHEDKIELDLHYVDNQSLLLDLKLIWRTFVKGFTVRSDIYEQRYSRDKERETDSRA